MNLKALEKSESWKSPGNLLLEKGTNPVVSMSHISKRNCGGGSKSTWTHFCSVKKIIANVSSLFFCGC